MCEWLVWCAGLLGVHVCMILYLQKNGEFIFLSFRTEQLSSSRQLHNDNCTIFPKKTITVQSRGKIMATVDAYPLGLVGYIKLMGLAVTRINLFRPIHKHKSVGSQLVYSDPAHVSQVSTLQMDRPRPNQSRPFQNPIDLTRAKANMQLVSSRPSLSLSAVFTTLIIRTHF